MAKVPFQAAPFDPVRSYDIPEVLATQLVDGELSWDSFRNTFFAPQKLSPLQRDT